MKHANLKIQKKLTSGKEKPSDYMIKELSEVDDKIKERDVSLEFHNAKDAIKWLERKEN